MSNCSASCGEGTKIITKISCRNQNEVDKTCNPESLSSVSKPCNATKKCEEPAVYGEWSPWGQCSLSCIKHIDEKSIKARARTGPVGAVGKQETKQCVVRFCSPECPRYHMEFATDDDEETQIEASIGLDKAKLFFGHMSRQDLILKPMSYQGHEKILSWQDHSL